MVFVGGTAATDAGFRRSSPAPLARRGSSAIPRSDLSAVTVGRRTFLVGGYDGSKIRDGARNDRRREFALLGDLPVPVRYAAVAAVGTDVYVIGGSNGGGAVRHVQALDTKTGAVRVIGELPQGLSDAVAATLEGISTCSEAIGVADRRRRSGVWKPRARPASVWPRWPRCRRRSRRRPSRCSADRA